MPRMVIPITIKVILLSIAKTIAASTPAVLLTAAEVWLLRAEASLRGINPKSESAKQCYETGVQASFDQWGAGDASLYLASKGKPTDYINHAAGPGKDMKALITTTPDFDDAANQEEQLEKLSLKNGLPVGRKVWKHGPNNAVPDIRNYSKSKPTIATVQLIRTS